MNKIALSIFFAILSTAMLYSQNEVDALRYARIVPGGTARYMSMGGAFGSLGADFSTISSNPAGLGLYKKSEFTITPAFYMGSTKSEYNGNKTDDSQSNFNLSDVGFVMNTETQNSVFKHFQFSFGLIRTNNFNNRIYIDGENNQNSIMTAYADDATGINPDYLNDGDYPYDLSPAWWNYMINPDFNCEGYCYTDTLPAGTNISQRKEINTWGSMNEYTFGFSTSVADRLYLGTSIAFPRIRYFEESRYTETNLDDESSAFRELTIYDDLETKGTGINLKFGMILRLTNFIRLGGAIHSPTWYNNMNDKWYKSHTAIFADDSFYEQSPYGNYSYELETPWRAMGSISLVLWRAVLVSADYEFVDYSQSKLRSSGYDFYDENTSINNKYTKTHNVKVGTEFRFGHFAMRGGFGYNMSPYADNINDGEKFTYSGGMGFRDKNFFLDLAYVRSENHENYYLYGSENVNVNPTDNKLITNNLLLTLGFRY